MATEEIIAHYRITAKLGAGGMGEVYRATDTKLGRDLALKVIPDKFAQDVVRMSRFKREAQVLASLNHPNIAAIYGVEDRALVMELVEGATLAERISSGPIPLEEALPIAKQIADALEYAHEHGIIHRDLKPANIKITPEGRVKVLDFGLAKALSSDAAPASDPDVSPTITLKDTTDGFVIGTAGYMSPEQARGKAVDKRADIWAFGAVLYEMVTGRRAFRGDSTASTLAAVLGNEPDPPTRITPEVPKELERIIQRCLRKDPNRRFHSMNDVKVELEEVREESESGMQTIQALARRRRRAWMYAAACIALLGIAGAIWWWRQEILPPPSPSQPVPLTAYEGD
jgi:serine/threonine-protein kinase